MYIYNANKKQNHFVLSLLVFWFFHVPLLIFKNTLRITQIKIQNTVSERCERLNVARRSDKNDFGRNRTRPRTIPFG